MKKKYIKLNDNYSHLAIGNIINVIKEESKNKSSAIQEEVFCALFNITYANESTVNNYCIGSRSLGNDYKQIYISLKKKYATDPSVFVEIIDNILTIVEGSIYDIKNIKSLNGNKSLKNICQKLYNISKNDFFVPKESITLFRNLLSEKNYYQLFVEFLLFAILEKKQPLYEDEKTKNIVETILQNTDISVVDLQNFLLLELNEGINFSYSLLNLAESGNAYANYEIAVQEYRGTFSGTPRFDKAYAYFEKASAKEHPSAYWMMGNMIMKKIIGNGSDEDLKKGFQYFKKAAKLGNIAAKNSLGLCYLKGEGTTKDTDKALALFQEAAKKNYAYAYNNLGLYYEKEKDYEKAYDYFLKSASLNESFACNRVGEYKRGKNIPKEALEYYEKALNSSIRERCIWAYYNIGKYYYLEGNLESKILKDEDKAISYFENSDSLIESLEELLAIYYKRNDVEKINYYKNKIESHPLYDEKVAKRINGKLKNIKDHKEKIIIP